MLLYDDTANPPSKVPRSVSIPFFRQHADSKESFSWYPAKSKIDFIALPGPATCNKVPKVIIPGISHLHGIDHRWIPCHTETRPDTVFPTSRDSIAIMHIPCRAYGDDLFSFSSEHTVASHRIPAYAFRKTEASQ
jgi:hypothetical protein